MSAAGRGLVGALLACAVWFAVAGGAPVAAGTPAAATAAAPLVRQADEAEPGGERDEGRESTADCDLGLNPSDLPDELISCGEYVRESVTDAVRTAVDEATDQVAAAASSAASAASDSFLDRLAEDVADFAEQATTGLLTMIQETGEGAADFEGQQWWDSYWVTLVGLQALIMLPLLLVAIGSGIVQRDPGRIARAMAEAPAAALMTVAAVPITVAAVQLVAALVSEVNGTTSDNVSAWSESVTPVLFDSSGSGAVSRLGYIVLIGAVGILALIAMAELFISQAAVSLAVLFMPIALAGRVWSGSRDMAALLARVIAGLVLMPLVISICLGAGVSALGQATGGGELDFPMAMRAIVIMLITALSPALMYRLLPVPGGDGAPATAGAGRALVGAGVGAAVMGGRLALAAGSGGATAAAGGGGGAAAGRAMAAGPDGHLGGTITTASGRQLGVVEPGPPPRSDDAPKALPPVTPTRDPSDAAAPPGGSGPSGAGATGPRPVDPPSAPPSAPAPTGGGSTPGQAGPPAPPRGPVTAPSPPEPPAGGTRPTDTTVQ
ncbi:type IV secretion system protein (plasmid) [Iamia sp. SCSIO 61187]|uniref:type IV secretion system protein n=1 Tax=Iamia sp. SCSIO 61187 TaxID=2722752 RepID=UPI001C63A002|nr:type IV secretion system protein [Iamia sp. SCSIO 61187]QYG95859.1 type IV secretion system protein [Iamia sp. SCSIO 61187]